MTPLFKRAVVATIKHEGGFNDIKHDRGGATNWGVSLRFLRSINLDLDGDGDIDFIDVKNMTKQQAEEIYFDNFWKPLYDRLPELVAFKVFDVSVNAGSSRAHILLQRALNKIGANLKTDGLIGPATLGVISKYTPQAIVNAYCVAQQEFYDGIIKRDPTQAKFSAGWKNRAKYLFKL
jgi:lysozyme family protein